MKKLYILLSMILLVSSLSKADNAKMLLPVSVNDDTLKLPVSDSLFFRKSHDYGHFPDSVYVWTTPGYGKKHYLKAAVESFGLNLAVNGFDRYVMQEDFAKISWSSIRHNINYGFVWDNDQFSTNLFAHPYHGGLYFNTARSNGLSFWESAPYSLCGSLMWEFSCEIEPAAINDLMATTIGGIAIGEVTHRMSALVLDDSKRGFNRFLREFVGTLICPMRGLNRLMSGEMWKVKRSHYKYHDYERIPVFFSMSTGLRYLSDDHQFFRGEYNPYLQLGVIYGDAFDVENTDPYDYLTANVQFGMSGNQPFINQVNLLGRLWGTSLKTSTEMSLQFGIFQYFNYYDSQAVLDGSGQIPYKISEAASIGPGFIYRFPPINHFVGIEQRVYLGAILLGGSLSDYYNVIDRNYNMGSGFSIKNYTTLDFGKYGRYNLNMEHYRIFTWKGYEHKDLSTVNPLYLNAQGDKGNVMLTVINPSMQVSLNRHLKIDAGISYYLRHTHYSYHNPVDYRTFDTKLGIRYEF